MKRKLQIDVLGTTEDNHNIMECKLYIEGRACLFYMSKSNYEALLYDGVFIRDGITSDSSGVINTTNTFVEKD